MVRLSEDSPFLLRRGMSERAKDLARTESYLDLLDAWKLRRARDISEGMREAEQEIWDMLLGETNALDR